jgi:hypothetical protein
VQEQAPCRRQVCATTWSRCGPGRSRRPIVPAELADAAGRASAIATRSASCRARRRGSRRRHRRCSRSPGPAPRCRGAVALGPLHSGSAAASTSGAAVPPLAATQAGVTCIEVRSDVDEPAVKYEARANSQPSPTWRPARAIARAGRGSKAKAGAASAATRRWTTSLRPSTERCAPITTRSPAARCAGRNDGVSVVGGLDVGAVRGVELGVAGDRGAAVAGDRRGHGREGEPVGVDVEIDHAVGVDHLVVHDDRPAVGGGDQIVAARDHRRAVATGQAGREVADPGGGGSPAPAPPDTRTVVRGGAQADQVVAPASRIAFRTVVTGSSPHRAAAA